DRRASELSSIHPPWPDDEMKSSRTRSESSSSNHTNNNNNANADSKGPPTSGTSLSEINDFLHPSVNEVPSYENHFVPYGGGGGGGGGSVGGGYPSNMSATYIPSQNSNMLHTTNRPRADSNLGTGPVGGRHPMSNG